MKPARAIGRDSKPENELGPVAITWREDHAPGPRGRALELLREILDNATTPEERPRR